MKAAPKFGGSDVIKIDTNPIISTMAWIFYCLF